jgi:hypothetical protein
MVITAMSLMIPESRFVAFVSNSIVFESFPDASANVAILALF